MTHRIRRQVLDLELPREAGAVALQRQVVRVFQEKVLPLLDEAFSQIAPEGRIVRIERLEIDLGRLGEAGWERNFIDRCVEQIARQVAEAAFKADNSTEDNVQILDAEGNAINVFQFFLEAGALPWYANGLSLKTLEEFIAAMAITRPGALRQALLPVFLQKETALQRLVWQFSQDFANAIVEIALDLPAGWVSHAVQILQSRTGRALDGPQTTALLRSLLRSGTSGIFRQPLRGDMFVAQYLEAQTGQPPSMQPTRQAPASSPDSPSHHTTPGEVRSDLAHSPLEQLPVPPEKAASWKAGASLTEGMLVDHAGLALLGVYLPAFFSELNLATETAFIDLEAQHHALHLLHFLATGQENPEEPALAFPKILCGMGLEEPVPQDMALTDAEKTECVHLLEAAVRNWPALKNTSPDGLRNGFLQRAGLLTHKEESLSWLLQVERQGQDILLERLPWSISVIKLPWMEGMLTVEW
jgi:hypothetical protein